MKKVILTIAILFAFLSNFAQAVSIIAPAAADTALSVINNGSGPVSSYITKNTDNTGALIYADHFGKGAGLRMRLMNAQNNNSGINVFTVGNGSGILSSSNKSKAGEFYANGGNTDTAVSIKHDGSGMGLNVDINNSLSAAVVFSAKTKGSGPVIEAAQNNAGSFAPVMNLTSVGFGTVATLNSSNLNNNTSALKINHAGKGQAIGIEMLNTNSTGNGISLVNPGMGNGIDIQLTNPENSLPGINIHHSGGGMGITATSDDNIAVWAISKRNSGTGILADNDFGDAIIGRSSSPAGYSAIAAINRGAGNGIKGTNAKDGIGVLGQAGVENGTGIAGQFENVNAANTSTVLIVKNAGTGNLAVFQKSNANKARIDNTGKAFFNGGTQNSGADMAEAFDVADNINNYEPGDVLMISTDKDRAVVKSTGAYTDLVIGVYATKPGMLMTEENIDTDLSDKVPMGVVGVIPTKVCLEGGEIQRGDLLVSSSIPGVAMKADKTKIKTGQCIGKALENFNGAGIGKIKLFVNVR